VGVKAGKFEVSAWGKALIFQEIKSDDRPDSPSKIIF
jgi:hypothetical protein